MLGVVVLVLLGAVAYSIGSVQNDLQDLYKRLERGEGGTVDYRPVRVQETPLKPVEAYVESVRVRDITLPPGTEPSTNAVAKKTDLEQKAANWKLLGVSLDREMESESMALIRDKSGQTTHFLKQGQRIGDSGVVVERILPDRVILKQDEEEHELR
jgi:hypothetical protein